MPIPRIEFPKKYDDVVKNIAITHEMPSSEKRFRKEFINLHNNFVVPAHNYLSSYADSLNKEIDYANALENEKETLDTRNKEISNNISSNNFVGDFNNYKTSMAFHADGTKDLNIAEVPGIRKNVTLGVLSDARHVDTRVANQWGWENIKKHYKLTSWRWNNATPRKIMADENPVRSIIELERFAKDYTYNRQKIEEKIKILLEARNKAAESLNNTINSYNLRKQQAAADTIHNDMVNRITALEKASTDRNLKDDEKYLDFASELKSYKGALSGFRNEILTIQGGLDNDTDTIAKLNEDLLGKAQENVDLQNELSQHGKNLLEVKETVKHLKNLYDISESKLKVNESTLKDVTNRVEVTNVETGKKLLEVRKDIDALELGFNKNENLYKARLERLEMDVSHTPSQIARATDVLKQEQQRGKAEYETKHRELSNKLAALRQFTDEQLQEQSRSILGEMARQTNKVDTDIEALKEGLTNRLGQHTKMFFDYKQDTDRKLRIQNRKTTNARQIKKGLPDKAVVYQQIHRGRFAELFMPVY